MAKTGKDTLKSAPLSEEELKLVFNRFEVDARWFYKDQELFERGIRAVANTPTGALYLRRFLNEHQGSPIEIDVSNQKGEFLGAYQPTEGKKISIYPRAQADLLAQSLDSEGILTQSEIAEQARDFIFGMNVLHELSHLRQNQEGLLPAFHQTTDPLLKRYQYFYIEAETQSLMHQLALESANQGVRSFYGISARQWKQYLSEAKRKNLGQLSLENQASFARDFLAPLDGKMNHTYAFLETRLSYLNQSGALAVLTDERVKELTNKENSVPGETDKTLRAKLRARFISLYGKSGAGMPSFEEVVPKGVIDHLAQEVIKEGMPPVKALDSERFKKSMQELQKALFFVQSMSPVIHEGNAEYQEISEEQRKVLREVFKLNLSEKNQKEERIAEAGSLQGFLNKNAVRLENKTNVESQLVPEHTSGRV